MQREAIARHEQHACRNAQEKGRTEFELLSTSLPPKLQIPSSSLRIANKVNDKFKQMRIPNLVLESLDLEFASSDLVLAFSDLAIVSSDLVLAFLDLAIAFFDLVVASPVLIYCWFLHFVLF
ncbi:hypothetical protein NE237_002574 [Protea cynaroides]|uniref:Uncharacterized protein n=1 Tax=Protea cynaroides TaxID=273540 RepID=A0A9Q0KV66_9MAGN|nr:hypothetical protein NE237_002574 [Protea cynaroides]